MIRLSKPEDTEIREALSEDVDAVAVLTEDDYVSLRLALVVENVCPGIPLVVTVFGRSIASQLEAAVSGVRVMSVADIVAPTFAGPCLEERLLSIVRTDDGFRGVAAGEDGPELVPIETPGRRRWQRLVANVGSVLRPFEPSARILTAGLLGFLAVLVIETVAVSLSLAVPLVDAFYATAKVIVTVGPNPAVDAAEPWFKVFSAVAMIAALAFTAIFTAGVVDRLLDRRLTTIVGKRVVPRDDHVIVVALGQVGLRLCLLLRELGLPVLAVEKDPDNYNVDRAKGYGLPVVIGWGGSRFLLDRLSLGRARALAAVASPDLENISVVVAARGMHSDLRTILRAGRGEVANETRSLFQIALVRDVYRIAGTLLAAAALGSEAREGFVHEGRVYLVGTDGGIEPFEEEIEDLRSPRAIAEARASGASTAEETRPAG